MSKVAVAMSGGVDSSVAAALVVEKYGRENVIGLTMKLFCYKEDRTTDKSCCSLESINDATAVCKQLGVPHYVVNLEKEFEAEIVEDFVSEYAQGRTPNPCIRCNSLIKFKHLLEKANKLGADILVTGHYARIVCDSNSKKQIANNPKLSLLPGRPLAEGNEDDAASYHLLCGIDNSKDQSYFLYKLNQKQLAHIWFPLGGLAKAETRKIAEKNNLRNAQKTESQDICFVATTTQKFLAGKIPKKPGNIVNMSGKIVGRHDGLPFYTIGQRKGLGGGFISPTYVIGLNYEKNEVIVGKNEELNGTLMVVGDVSWTNLAPDLPTELDVKIRYNSEVAKATLSRDQKDIEVKFHSPQRAITPGQTAVFYSGEEVLGGGIILST
jgi:tRNA-specific 2-thiouridylase